MTATIYQFPVRARATEASLSLFGLAWLILVTLAAIAWRLLAC